MPLASSSRVGAYEIIAQIGAGGMGEVYRASDPRLKRDVAIKVLPAAFAKDAERMRRFELEAQAAGRLNHPNVLAIYDIGVHDSSPYLVSELLEGESLRSRLRAGKLSPQRALDYARQVAAGLAAAHAAGIVHRDLKPENLFVTKDGRVKILDFGLAKQTQTAAAGEAEETRLETTPGTVLGTVAYMSPEQVRGQTVDHRSDIFSFGCVLHEMLTGEQPYKGESSADTMSAILTQDPPELALGSGLAPALDRIVRHCLEKNPEQRFQSAQDLAFDLASVSEVSQAGRSAPPPRRRRRRVMLAAALLGIALAFGAFFLGRLSTPRSLPEFQRLTFRRGSIGAARFAPDGNTIVYGAIWEDDPSEIFAVRLESPESRPLGFQGAALFSIARSGELALALNQSIRSSPLSPEGLLARAPFSGGAPRAIEDRIVDADWSPDGAQMALVRATDRGAQLEYPSGTVLYRTAGMITHPRISPSGEQVAFIDHKVAFDTAGSIAVVSRSSPLRSLTGSFDSAVGLAWKGDEIWFSAALAGSREDLWAVTLGGRQRLVYRQAANLVLHDISADGRVLVANQQWRQRMIGRGPSDSRDREFTWLDWSLPTALSPDGRLVAFSETGEGAAGHPAVYLREIGGAAAVKLGAGAIAFFSVDGKFVVSSDPGPSEVIIYPVGPGPTRHLRLKGFAISAAGLLPDGRRIWFDGNPPSQERRIYLTTVDGEAPRPLTPEGAQPVPPFITPDGNYFIARTGGATALFPVAGGRPEPLPGVDVGERTTGWAADSRSYLVFRRGDSPAKVYRVDRLTGRREFVKEIGPSERAGIGPTGTNLHMTADGETYLYSMEQILSELYLVRGLK